MLSIIIVSQSWHCDAQRLTTICAFKLPKLCEAQVVPDGLNAPMLYSPKISELGHIPPKARENPRGECEFLSFSLKLAWEMSRWHSLAWTSPLWWLCEMPGCCLFSISLCSDVYVSGTKNQLVSIQTPGRFSDYHLDTFCLLYSSFLSYVHVIYFNETKSGLLFREEHYLDFPWSSRHEAHVNISAGM